MYPPQPSLASTPLSMTGRELDRANLTDCCSFLLKSASPEIRGGADRRRGKICKKNNLFTNVYGYSNNKPLKQS